MTRIQTAWLAAILMVVACGGGGGRPSAPAQNEPQEECVDADGDGRGEHCEDGPDCDDTDPSAGKECMRCAQPNTGCACVPGSLPEGCFLDKTQADDGTVMCHEGTRYCREGTWSSCEDVHSYPQPEHQGQSSLIDIDAGAVQCNDCSVACFRVSDNLDPIDGGLNNGNSNGTAFVPGGGLTLGTRPLDGGIDPEDPPYDPSTCMIGVAPDIDCDGIPDEYDPFPNDPPFATAAPGLFLDIGPGETGTGVIDLDFFINSADVYFLIDQSASMTDERDNLKADLVSGDFIADNNYDCADVNLNHIADDNGLKAQGIVGAIKCIIRDASFGVGYHREIPFTDYADNKQIAYDNYQDITNVVADMVAGVNRLDTIGNIDWPEASMLALNNVVTGNGMYFGTTKRGIPPRVDCPAGTWGYPCFRDSAIPIVILITDAMMHNGPDNNRFPYTASKLGLTRGTSAQYFPVNTTNETFLTAYNAGDLTSTVKTFTGDSSTMTSAIDRSTLSCLTQNGGADAFFRFDLTQTRTVRISSEGSRYDTVVGLYAGQPQTPTVLPASANTNETAATATDLGNISGASVRITGNTTAMTSHYDWSTVQCNADPTARDAVYRFNVTAPTNVDISTAGSAFDTVVSLHSGVPPLSPTYTASTNTNENLESATLMGNAYNSVLAYSGSTTGRTANYQGAELGCGADTTSPDVAYRFTLSQPTRVRVSTEGSAYDTVIGLVGDTCGGTPSTPPTTTDTSGSTATTGTAHTFLAGSIVIPMDTTYQNLGMLRAYGLVYTLLKNDIPVSWVIKKNKIHNEADFTASATNYSNPLITITNHGYRGGPFVIDSTDATRAASIITAYLVTNPTVAVHRLTTSFEQLVRRQLSGAPRMALMLDGGEATARAYLAAAGITDSAGTAFPDAAADTLTAAELAGATTTAINGALFDSGGTPRYCGLISTGWPAASAVTAQGLEVVRETRAFLEHPVSFFAQAQSVLSFEGSTNGRFITQAGYTAGGALTNLFEANIDTPYAQIDGSLSGGGGSVPSLALPQPDHYKDGDAPIFGKEDGSIGEADLWVTARLDGDCSILNASCGAGEALGTINYLAGQTYSTTLPPLTNSSSNGVRLFLNALFAADCNLREQKPAPTISLTGNTVSTSANVTYTITYNNDGDGVAHSAYIEYPLPAGATFVSATGGGTFASGKVTWTLPSLSVDETSSFTVTVQYPAYASYANQATIFYTQGNTTRSALSWVVTTNYTNAGDLMCTALGVNNVTVAGTSHETQANAYSIGQVAGRIYRLTGTTAGMAGNYTTAETGATCGAALAGPDAAYTFTLGQAANVTISTEGTAWDSTLALYNGSVSPSDTVAATNTNETTSAPTALGPVNGKRIALSGATTQSMIANYTTEVGCTSDASAPDAVYSFTLTAPTTVKLSTAGSSFDTVLSLHNNPIVAPPSTTVTTLASNTNDRTQSAYAFPVAVNGADQTLVADSGSLAAQYALASSCYNLNFLESLFGGGSSAAPDAVFSFRVNTAGNFDINTNGTGYDNVLAVYPQPARFTTLPVDDIGEADTTLANRWPGGSVTQSVINVSGTTNNNASTWTATDCSATASARDAFVAFSVTGAGNRSITLDTTGSSFNTVVMLYQFTNAAQTTYMPLQCDDDISGSNSASLLTRSLSAGNYFAVITGDNASDDGTYQLRISDGTPSTNQTACNDDSGADGSDARLATQALGVGDYYAFVKGVYSSSGGAYTLQIRDNSLPTTSTPNRVDCNDDANSTTQSELTASLGIGTYYVVVKGGTAAAKGTYALTVEDTLNPPVGAIMECDDNDGPSGSSIISRSLAAGTYSVVLKGKTAAASGAYTLRVLDQNASVGTILECNDDAGVDGSSVIERNLAAGSYYVIVKGDGAGEGGNYKVSVRDVTNQGYRFLQCDDDSAAALTSRITRDLTPGTYYAVVKGDAAADRGAYSLVVQDTANSPLGAISCNDDGGTYKTSVISRSLSAGTYYVALKGYSATEKGKYQLTIGGGTTSSGSYVPPTWSQTLTALNNRGVRVIPVLSCQDDPDHGDNDGDCEDTREQAITLANSTDALGINGEPLVFDIDRDGDGLSRKVVEGVASLAEYLEMDVRVVVKFDPDANPGFTVAIAAVDEVGDGCSGLIGSEHQNCAPGATPRFNIAFTNPLPGVPHHPTDPNGGYTFRAQLIGDDQFIVEEVPIYIIPERLEPVGPEEPPIYEEGSYWQDTASPGCSGFNQLPDWRDLSWDADVYDNTTIRFMACTSGTVAGLNSCVPKEIASVTGAGLCDADSDCEVGYCDTGIGVCQVARVGMCLNDMQCGVGAFCDETVEQCTYLRQPVYIGAVLGTDNFARYLRMTIGMSVVVPYEDPPVLHRWDMTYYCNNAL
jgi:hypothetical protein